MTVCSLFACCQVSHGEFLQHLTSDKYMQNCLLAAMYVLMQAVRRLGIQRPRRRTQVKCGPMQCAQGSGDAYEAVNAQYEQVARTPGS